MIFIAHSKINSPLEADYNSGRVRSRIRAQMHFSHTSYSLKKYIAGKLNLNPAFSNHLTRCGSQPWHAEHEYHYRVMNLISNVQGWGPVCFLVVDLYKSHARTSSNQLSVLSFYVTPSNSMSAQLSWISLNEGSFVLFPAPDSFQTTFHDVDTSLVPRLISLFHTRGRKSLDWAIVQLPNVTWTKCYHYHPITPYPPGRADRWSGTGCIRCRRWTNTPLSHLSSFQWEDTQH